MEYVTVIISIFAILLTYRQISLSNKQSLFDRRIALYEKSEKMYGLWNEHQNLLDYKIDILVPNAMYFSLLTNIDFLYEIVPVMKTLVENVENHIKFLLKMEELERLSIEIEFAFKGNSAKNIALFVSCYRELLSRMFEYEMTSSKVKKEINELKKRTLSDFEYEKERIEIIENSLEPKTKREVNEIIDKLVQITCEIEKDDSFTKIKKQIKLFEYDLDSFRKRN